MGKLRLREIKQIFQISQLVHSRSGSQTQGFRLWGHNLNSTFSSSFFSAFLLWIWWKNLRQIICGQIIVFSMPNNRAKWKAERRWRGRESSAGNVEGKILCNVTLFWMHSDPFFTLELVFLSKHMCYEIRIWNQEKTTLVLFMSILKHYVQISTISCSE